MQDCADVENRGGRARVRVLGGRPHARDPRRPPARAVRGDQPRDLHLDHRHRARRDRARRMGRRQARRPRRSAPAARPHRGPRRAALPVHRPAGALVRRPVDRRRPRRHALPCLRRLLPPRRRAQRGHADGREAAAPRPPAHRRRRRPAERHLDLRRPRRHVRHRLPARGDDADPHRHLRHRRHPDGDRHRARALARPARQRRLRRPRGARRRGGDDGCGRRALPARWRARTTASRSSTTSRSRVGASSGSTTSCTATSISTTRRTSSSTTSSRSATRSRWRGPKPRRWTRCTSAAEASRCRGISPPSIPAPRARCWRSIPPC